MGDITRGHCHTRNLILTLILTDGSSFANMTTTLLTFTLFASVFCSRLHEQQEAELHTTTHRDQEHNKRDDAPEEAEALCP